MTVPASETDKMLRQDQRILDAMGGIVWEADAELACTFISRPAEALLGYPLQRWTSEPAFWLRCVHPDDREAVRQFLLEQTSRLPPRSLECRLVAADGRVVWFQNLVCAEGAGPARKLRGRLVDITRLKQTEQRLRESEESYRQIAEAAQEGIWRIDAEARTTFVNRKMAGMLGYSVEEMFGRDLSEFMDAEARQLLRKLLSRRRQGVAERHEFVFLKKDGRKLWTSVSANPLYDEGGAYHGALAVLTDISQQRWTDALVSAQRGIFEILARGEPDALQQALNAVVLAIEGIVEGVLGSVLLLGADGKRLWCGAGPSLPPAYNQAIHGALIGPDEGSCGSAAFRKQQIITPDIMTDLRWVNYRGLAAQHGLRACWSTPIFDRGGQVLGTFAMYFREVRSPTAEELRLVGDATAAAALAIQHVRIRDSLARTISQLEATIESTADGILVVDRDGTIQRYNRRVMDMWGIPESLMETRDMGQVLAVALQQLRDPAAVLRRLAEIHEHPETPALDVLDFQDERVFERHHQVLRIGAEVAGDVWSFRDVTERKRAEAALRESEQRFRILAEATMEGVVLHEGGVILLANEGLARMYGYGLAEMIGMRVEKLAAPESRGAVFKSIQSGTDQVYEAIGIRKDGSRFWGEVRSRLAEFEGRQVRVVVVRDVSDRRHLEEARERNLAQERQARLEAERSVKQYDDFLEIASHELKTPLTPLKMYLQLLRHTLRTVALPPSQQTTLLLEALDNTDREYNRLLGLIDDLLDVSRITAGQLLLAREATDLSRIAADVCARFEPELVHAGTSLKLSVAPGAWGYWDRSRIEQVVANLLLNALKYGAGRPVEVRVEPQGGMAVLTVRDQGPGISQEEQTRIFERFSRAAPITNYGGLGLGLYIARQIVRAHGGTISVESALGQGASFVVRLPLGEAATADG